jgi:formylglycine-generating enzyme required for sulfatase activity
MRVLSVRASSALVVLFIASAASAVTMAWTPIGNQGNTCDPQSQGCFGSVPYSYSIGTYEVTNAQYVEFLNAKASSFYQPFGLYNTLMSPSFYNTIARSISVDGYTYSAVAGRENVPVDFVSLYDALRFANWMNNGQGSGDTETGAYTLLGGTEVPSNGATVTRNAGAVVFVPTEDEWYKAAYYNPATSSYFAYPAGSNAQTTCSAPTAAPNHANCSLAANDLTAVGSYMGSPSPYGSIDQGGNVYEWNEAVINGELRGLRGGAAGSLATDLGAFTRHGDYPVAEDYYRGFRLAFIPEPSAGLLVAAGLTGLAVRRRGPTPSRSAARAKV